MFSYLPGWMRPKNDHPSLECHVTPVYCDPHPIHINAPIYIEPFIPSRGLCLGCGLRPRFQENTGRVHDYCGKTCARQYEHLQPVKAPKDTPLCLGCGLRPQNTLEGFPHCSRACAKRYPLTLFYPCLHNGCNAKTLNMGGYCTVHVGRGKLLNIQTTAHKKRHSGPNSARPLGDAPSPPPLRKYSYSNPTPPPLNPPSSKEILFYDKHAPHYGFTNFSDHPVEYKGHRYPTSEHLFQSLKFLDHRPDMAREIRKSKGAREAFNTARHYHREIRPDWLHGVNIAMMDIVLLHKFRQHKGLRDELLDTGDAILIEDSPIDSFWGNGADKSGKNELGNALMRLRTKFQRGEI